jgi:hypothetical protein
LGLQRKAFLSQGDFHAEGDSKLFVKGVPPNLPSKKQTVRNSVSIDNNSRKLKQNNCNKEI